MKKWCLFLALALMSSSVLSQISDYEWTAGQPAIKMTGSYFSVCVLTGVSGKFAGRGELIEISKGPDNFWYLGGSSLQGFLWARASCVQKIHFKDIGIDVIETPWFGKLSAATVGNGSCPVSFITAVRGTTNADTSTAAVWTPDARWWDRQFVAVGALNAKGICLQQFKGPLVLAVKARKGDYAIPGKSVFENLLSNEAGGFVTTDRFMCGFTALEGYFRGGAERVELRHPAGALKGVWQVSMTTLQANTGGKVACFQYRP